MSLFQLKIIYLAIESITIAVSALEAALMIKASAESSPDVNSLHIAPDSVVTNATPLPGLSGVKLEVF